MFVDSFWCYVVIGFLVCLLMVSAFALVYVFVVAVQSSSRSSYLRAWGSYGVVLFKFPSFFIVAVWHWAGDFCQGLGSTVLSFEIVWLSRRLVCGRWPIFIVFPSKGTITVSDRRLYFSCVLVSLRLTRGFFTRRKLFNFVRHASACNHFGYIVVNFLCEIVIVSISASIFQIRINIALTRHYVLYVNTSFVLWFFLVWFFRVNAYKRTLFKGYFPRST